MADERARDPAHPRAAARPRRRRRRRSRRRLLVVLAVALIAAAVAVVAISRGGEPEKPAAFVRPAGDAPATVWAIGDSADGRPAASRVADLIARGKPDRVLYMGDVYESGTAEEFAGRYEPAYGRFAEITAPTPGNHDWSNREEGYDAYWEEEKDTETPDFYDFRIAGWQLIALNSEDEHGPGSAQVKWLQGRLKGPGNCRLAFWHRPRFSAGSHGDDPTQDTLWKPLPGKAAIVVNAHEHNLQRLKTWQGIAQYIVGAGGHSHYFVHEEDPRLAFSNDTEDGALRIDLRPGRATMSFVAVDGRVLDRSTVRCRR